MIYLPNTFPRWGDGTIPSLQKGNRYKEIWIREKYTNSGCLVCDKEKLVTHKWQDFLLEFQFFFSCSLCHFSNWSGVYSASTSPCLCFPFPSFTFPSHASSHSEMVLSVPQPVSMPPPYYSFRCFYQSHLLYLRWFSSFFPIPCSINLISIFLVQPVLQSLFLHANFIPSPTYFLLAHLTQQSPSPFLTAFRLFFPLFPPQPQHLQLLPFCLVSHCHQCMPASSANSSSQFCEGVIFLVLVPSRGFPSWRGEIKSFLLLVALRPDIICNCQASCFSPVLNHAPSKQKLWKT